MDEWVWCSLILIENYLSKSFFIQSSFDLSPSPFMYMTENLCLARGKKRVQFQIQNPFIYDDNAWQPPIFSTFYLKNPKSNPPLFAHTKKAQRQLFLWYRMHLPLNYDRRVNSLYRYCLIINNKTLDTLYSDFGCRKKEQSGFSYQNEEKTGKVTLRLTLIKRYVKWENNRLSMSPIEERKSFGEILFRDICLSASSILF